MAKISRRCGKTPRQTATHGGNEKARASGGGTQTNFDTSRPNACSQQEQIRRRRAQSRSYPIGHDVTSRANEAERLKSDYRTYTCQHTPAPLSSPPKSTLPSAVTLARLLAGGQKARIKRGRDNLSTSTASLSNGSWNVWEIQHDYITSSRLGMAGFAMWLVFVVTTSSMRP